MKTMLAALAIAIGIGAAGASVQASDWRKTLWDRIHSGSTGR